MFKKNLKKLTFPKINKNHLNGNTKMPIIITLAPQKQKKL